MSGLSFGSVRFGASIGKKRGEKISIAYLEFALMLKAQFVN